MMLENANKLFLKRSANVVHAAQKRMMASGETDKGGRLGKAVLLQSYAVSLFKAGKESQAICASAAARKMAADIQKEITGKEDAYSQFTAEESKMIGNCAKETDLLVEAKSAMSNISVNDSDYKDPHTLNFNNIDIQ